jgi:hypothetical protein
LIGVCLFDEKHVLVADMGVVLDANGTTLEVSSTKK